MKSFPEFLEEFLQELTSEQAQELREWMDDHRGIDMVAQIEAFMPEVKP